MSTTELFVVDIAAGGSLRVNGVIDLSCASQLRRALGKAIDTTTGDIVVDLSGVTFFDSTGLRELCDANKQLAAGQRHLRIATPSPHVVRVLKLVGLPDECAALLHAVEPAAD